MGKFVNSVKGLHRKIIIVISSFSFLILPLKSNHTTPSLNNINVSKASFLVSSPFSDDYGYYSLADPNHNISNYLSTIPVEFSYEDGSILLKAPYLTYTTEDDRYYYGTIEDTKEGSSSIGPYDTWELSYNDQPYITSTSGISLQAYRGDTYISDISYSLSGNSVCTSSKYYLQNLLLSFSMPSNITSIKLLFNSVTYTSSYHEVVDIDDIYIDIPEHVYNSYTTTKTGSTKNRYIDVSLTFPIPENYSTIAYGIEDQRGTISSYTIRRYDYDAGTVTFRINFNTTGSNVSYSYKAYATFKKPASSEYDKTITTTYIDGGTYNSISNVAMSNLYWFPSFFLETINCSGRGDQNDKEMVINNWNTVATHFSFLPSSYQEAFSNGTLDDPSLLEALTRYDYVVFYKNYGLVDFASRASKSNRYYLNNTSKIKTIFNEDNNDYLIIIIASITMIISISTLVILLVRKKIRN